MRTTLELDDQLLRVAKVTAAAEGRTLTSVIEDALRTLLTAPQGAAAPPVQLPTVSGRGPRPGIDIDDSAGLLDLMEAGDAAS